MSKIVVLQGAPASGKSTWAKDFVKNRKDWVIVSRDEIREATGKYWVPERENYISEVEEFQIRSAIKNSLNVIIDATNLNSKTIEKWKNLAEELYIEIEFKPFYIDFKTALERDIGRPRSVGKKVLEGFFLRYFPEELEKYYTDNRKILEKDPSKKDCIIVDLDGTVCIHCGRNPYDLTRVSEDKPNIPLIELLYLLNTYYEILFVSGREGTVQCYQDSFNWLKSNFRTDEPLENHKSWSLIMRNPHDFRPDEVIKEEIYHNCIEPSYNVISVFDDRDKVVKMWRDLGLLCNQVYYGDF